MTTPVVICDDSSFARKQVARALPKGWDVEITFTTNGREGVQAIEAGKGDILFLDLTMPEMDGFDVLEYIRDNDLPTIPIVISGDIQPESHQRVMALGAVAFIKKPVDAEALCEILDSYGVLGVLNGEAIHVENQIGFTEWCQETVNVAMGRAANLLAQVIHGHIDLSIPHVRILDYPDLTSVLAHELTGDSHSLVAQGFIGGDISGETLLHFYDAEAEDLAELMGRQISDDEDIHIELNMDIANILVGAFLTGFAEQLDISFSQGHPCYLHSDSKRTVHLRKSAEVNEKVLAIKFNYTIGEGHVHCEQWALITDSSIEALIRRSGEDIAEP